MTQSPKLFDHRLSKRLRKLRHTLLLTALAVAPALLCPPVCAQSITSLTASPATINPGFVTKLSWSVANATDIVIDQSVGDVTGQPSVYVAPAQTTTYTVTASNGSSL